MLGADVKKPPGKVVNSEYLQGVQAFVKSFDDSHIIEALQAKPSLYTQKN